MHHPPIENFSVYGFGALLRECTLRFLNIFGNGEPTPWPQCTTHPSRISLYMALVHCIANAPYGSGWYAAKFRGTHPESNALPTIAYRDGGSFMYRLAYV
jgi:hypothetical protein